METWKNPVSGYAEGGRIRTEECREDGTYVTSFYQINSYSIHENSITVCMNDKTGNEPSYWREDSDGEDPVQISEKQYNQIWKKGTKGDAPEWFLLGDYGSFSDSSAAGNQGGNSGDEEEQEKEEQQLPAEEPEETQPVPFYGIWIYASKNQEEAASFAGQVQEEGIDAEVYITSQWSNLNEETWYVVSAGEYATEQEAQAALSAIQSAGYSSAYVKYTGEWIE